LNTSFNELLPFVLFPFLYLLAGYMGYKLLDRFSNLLYIIFFIIATMVIFAVSSSILSIFTDNFHEIIRHIINAFIFYISIILSNKFIKNLP